MRHEQGKCVTLTPEQLITIQEEIGKQGFYRTLLAERFSISKSGFNRYVNGASPIPISIYEKLRKLLGIKEPNNN